MDTQIDLKKLLKKGSLSNELEFQRASIIDRQLRLLVKENPNLAQDRMKLRSMLKEYEDHYWVNVDISDKQVEESDFAIQIAEQENSFKQLRKQTIRLKLKEKGLTQKELGLILGHNSETYMSELINGIRSFILNDLILIHKVLSIDISKLVPTVLNLQVIDRAIDVISKLNNPKLPVEKREFVKED